MGVSLTLASLCHAVSLEEVQHEFEGGTASAYRIENRFFSLVLVPERGGRIAHWVDKRDTADLTWLGETRSSYGGLLDDHESFATQPYDCEVIAQSEDEVTLRLTGHNANGVQSVKTLTIYDDRPVLKVHYELSNPSQDPMRALFRNVVRPSGTATSDDDLYCFPTTEGIVRSTTGFGRLGRTDNLGAPWMAYVSQSQQRAISTSFEGDVLRRFYSWRGSKDAPTYEFMFKLLEPGQRYEVTYYWQLTHELTAVDHATRDLVMQVEPRIEEGTLQASVRLCAVWEDLDDVVFTQRWLPPDREPISEPRRQDVGELVIDSAAQIALDGPAAPDDAAYVILEGTVESNGRAIAHFEKPVPIESGDDTPDYERKLAWHSQTEIETIPDWQREAAYTVQPDTQDRERGYVLYEPFGPTAGKRVERIELHMGMNEPETLPIFLYPLRDIGEVAVNVERPEDMPDEAVTLLRGEPAPYENWGQTRIGWKLPEADRVTPAVEEESSMWLRLHTRGWTPGRYVLPITFRPQHAETQRVELVVQVHPVRFPQRPTFVFNAHMLLNFLLASGEGPRHTHDWDFEKGRPYLKDLQAHGNKVLVSYGQNSLTGGGWRAILLRAALRESGQTLGEVIEADRDRFRSESLPELDLSYWDPLFDAAIAHGFTVYRTYLGGTGSVRDAFLQISRQIWDDPEMTADDPRHLAIHRWLYAQINRYVRDRGYQLVLGKIDDEIPHEKYEQWIADAAWARELGFVPGLTQSNALLMHDERMRQMGPALDYPIIGAINKELLERRLAEGLLDPVWLETYESTANYWKQYGEERIATGWLPGYLELDACWIQCYYRWRQSEAIIFPTDDGPVTTAAWEGARDGLDDANYYQIALALVKRMTAADASRGQTYRQRLEQIISPSEEALLGVTLRQTRLGEITTIQGDVDVADMRRAKRRLLELITALRDELPAQRPSLRYGQVQLTDAGAPGFAIVCPPELTAARRQLGDVLRRLDDELTLDQLPATGHRLVLATFDRLPIEQVPALRTLTADLSARYPGADDYVIRTATVDDGSTTIALIGGDEAGLEKAVASWAAFLEHAPGDKEPAPVRSATSP